MLRHFPTGARVFVGALNGLKRLRKQRWLLLRCHCLLNLCTGLPNLLDLLRPLGFAKNSNKTNILTTFLLESGFSASATRVVTPFFFASLQNFSEMSHQLWVVRVNGNKRGQYHGA